VPAVCIPPDVNTSALRKLFKIGYKNKNFLPDGILFYGFLTVRKFYIPQ
jgi:hypothetical protein